jgi:DUF4097 and DUF4098 domain-containing protein YvlB
VKPEVLRRASVAAGVALLSVSLGACDLAMSGYHEEARDIFSKTYPLAENGRLEIVNSNGSIKVDPSDGSQVEVRAERIARAATQQGAKELLAANEIKEDISSDRVHLDSRSQGKFLRGGVEVRYTIRVPAGAVVDLRNTNGTVEATGITHGAKLSTTNGRVMGHGLGGEVHASTTNGGVDLEMRSLTNDVEASTTNGAISLAIPPSASAEISASVTNGGIRLEGLPGLKAADENSRRRFSGRLNDGDHRIRLSTTNGGINISGRSGSEAASKSERKKTEQPVER